MKTFEQKFVADLSANFYVDDDGVLVSRSKTSPFTLKELDENYLCIKSMVHGKVVCGMIEQVSTKQFDRLELDFMEKEYPKLYKALAITIKSPLARVKAFLALRIIRRKLPIKIFASADQAKTWLKAYK